MSSINISYAFDYRLDGQSYLDFNLELVFGSLNLDIFLRLWMKKMENIGDKDSHKVVR